LGVAAVALVVAAIGVACSTAATGFEGVAAAAVRQLLGPRTGISASLDAMTFMFAMSGAIALLLLSDGLLFVCCVYAVSCRSC
jgi:hypothetical protein